MGMAIQLEVRDGVPVWYLSMDIWVVPGPDPNGPPGMATEGEPAYVCARVTNNGSTTATDAVVNFKWANPNVVQAGAELHVSLLTGFAR